MPTRGYGELSTADALVNDERQAFLDVAANEVPELFLDLAKDVLPWYRDLPDPRDEEGSKRTLRQRRTSLQTWAERYTADLDGNEWLSEFAFQLVKWWVGRPQDVPEGTVRPLNFQWALPSSTYVGCEPAPFVFDPIDKVTGSRMNVWHPEFGKWENFRRRLRSLFLEQLEAYRKAQTERLIEASATLGAQLFRGEVYKDRKRKDLLWLARYQFRGASYTALSREIPRADRRVIQRRVEKAAKRIGLKLRGPSPGGRPPSSK